MSTSTDRQLFRATLGQVAEQARAMLPQAVNGRIEKAVTLVLHGDVEAPGADGSVTVYSATDATRRYVLHGAGCTCADFERGQAPEGWCAHRIAANIARRVRELLPVALPCEPFPDNDPGPVEELPPTPAVEPTTPTPASCPEARFSLTLKGHIDGHEALLTARGQTADEFRRNLDAIRGLLDARPEPAQTPTGQGEGWCSQHGMAMKWNEGRAGRKGWHSHRTAQGWCQGK